MDSTKILIIIVILLCGGIGFYSYRTSLELRQLKAQTEVVEQKVDSLMIATAKIAQSTKTISKKQPKSFWEALFSEIEADNKAAAAQKRAEAAKAKVVVSASYRLEDRYVIGRVELPEYFGEQAGQVTVNIIVNEYGRVNKTSVADGATITDPEVIEAVRRAALKTSFNSNYDSSVDVEGTITYIFKKK